MLMSSRKSFIFQAKMKAGMLKWAKKMQTRLRRRATIQKKLVEIGRDSLCLPGSSLSSSNSLPSSKSTQGFPDKDDGEASGLLFDYDDDF
mmetsp:Transcript_61356/g.150181  ORF Transcript_61356/g.150181 Transcript_61356/m.150181 type:complete len:90 (+) Transcript_61356:220-489(+)